jgi:periplasmic divalent cation tolerance protein
MPLECAIVLTTVPMSVDAAAFARVLIEERLAACVNLLPPMESIYRWQGNIEQESERQIVIKTSRDRVDALRERLHALHPYDVPEFVVVPIVGGSDAYLRWIGDNARSDADPRAV